jgi:hypothetical protein
MGTPSLRRHTRVRDRGQRVTIVGVPSDGLLALTGYVTEAGSPRSGGLDPAWLNGPFAIT